jgi:FkbM family methyltransferase
MSLLFIDAGANQGDITAWLLDQPCDAHAVVIEANPELIPRLQKRFAQKPVQVRHAAMWTHEQGVELFLTDAATDPQRVGATVCEGKTTNRVNYKQGVRVPSVDVAKLLTEIAIVTDRQIVLKLDIEGAEYAVIERLFARGAASLLAGLVVETHVHKVQSITKERHERMMESLHAWGGQPIASHTTWHAFVPKAHGAASHNRDLVGLLQAMLQADTRCAHAG